MDSLFGELLMNVDTDAKYEYELRVWKMQGVIHEKEWLKRPLHVLVKFRVQYALRNNMNNLEIVKAKEFTTQIDPFFEHNPSVGISVIQMYLIFECGFPHDDATRGIATQIFKFALGVYFSSDIRMFVGITVHVKFKTSQLPVERESAARRRASSVKAIAKTSPVYVEPLDKLAVIVPGDNDNEDVCPICLELPCSNSSGGGREGGSCLYSSRGRILRLPCSHVFHWDCMARCLERSNLCPMCRSPLPH